MAAAAGVESARIMHGSRPRLIMPFLTIRHVTTYRYRRPVAFGEHRMMHGICRRSGGSSNAFVEARSVA
jgi:Bacterial transglutaminase-like N-terminal region